MVVAGAQQGEVLQGRWSELEASGATVVDGLR
jgi:hypothetical protein